MQGVHFSGGAVVCLIVLVSVRFGMLLAVSTHENESLVCFMLVIQHVFFPVCFSRGQGETLPEYGDTDDADGGVPTSFCPANQRHRSWMLGINEDFCVRFSLERDDSRSFC